MVMGDQVLKRFRPIEQCVRVEDVQGVNVTSSRVRDVRLWTLQAVRWLSLCCSAYQLLWSEKTTPSHLNTPDGNVAL